jgi:hypothetical protein
VTVVVVVAVVVVVVVDYDYYCDIWGIILCNIEFENHVCGGGEGFSSELHTQKLYKINTIHGRSSSW